MAQFYGVLQGNRGEASRLGSKDSGLRVAGYSWNGGAEIELYHDDETGQDCIRVSLVPHFQTGRGERRELYSGPVSAKREDVR